MNYLQLNDNNRLDPEEQAVADVLGSGNYQTFYKKHIIQNKLKITRDDFIMGEIPSMFAAMRQLGIEYAHCDYPEDLWKHLHRKVWTSTMGDIKRVLFDDGQVTPIFIKPKDKLKKFTGFVITSIDDLQFTSHAGNNTNIWCSEPVIWLSEFRCPVINGKVRGMFRVPYTCHDSEKQPDISIVQQMADDFKSSPKAYCLDVGVLSTGETALIEINDGFSIGKYDMGSELYYELLKTRWDELKNK